MFLAAKVQNILCKKKKKKKKGSDRQPLPRQRKLTRQSLSSSSKTSFSFKPLPSSMQPNFVPHQLVYHCLSPPVRSRNSPSLEKTVLFEDKSCLRVFISGAPGFESKYRGQLCAHTQRMRDPGDLRCALEQKPTRRLWKTQLRVKKESEVCVSTTAGCDVCGWS